MAGDDAVAEAPFCVACRRSSAVKWRKHVFSRGHQQAAQQFLLRHAGKLQEFCDAATTTGFASDGNWWRCVFCDVALATADAVAHFSGDEHRAQVEAFCRHHRCDADRQTRPQLWLQAAKRRELEAALSTGQAAEEQQAGKQMHELEPVDQAASERVEAFLSSAASRLQEVQMERRRTVNDTNAAVEPATREHQEEALLGPQFALATAPSRCKTVSSAEGVLQNPLGRHEGKRVWGGGIVKLRKNEWVPWAIDQLVKEEQADRPETQHAGKDGPAFVHRVTELVRGEGLSSIASVSWGAGVGNVHTSAVPPWMVETEDEYKKCNRREHAAPTPLPPTKTADDRAEATATKRRDIFSELQSKSEYGPDWLPNFGGVWQEGPRSKTKQAFRKASGVTKSSRDQNSLRPMEHQAPQSVSQGAPPTKALSQPFPPRPPPAPTVDQQYSGNHFPSPAEMSTTPQQEAPVLIPPQAPAADNIKTTDPLEAKKQMLLAQKERLRAKMAARRRKE